MYLLLLSCGNSAKETFPEDLGISHWVLGLGFVQFWVVRAQGLVCQRLEPRSLRSMAKAKKIYITATGVCQGSHLIQSPHRTTVVGAKISSHLLKSSFRRTSSALLRRSLLGFFRLLLLL